MRKKERCWKYQEVILEHRVLWDWSLLGSSQTLRWEPIAEKGRVKLYEWMVFDWLTLSGKRRSTVTRFTKPMTKSIGMCTTSSNRSYPCLKMIQRITTKQTQRRTSWDSRNSLFLSKLGFTLVVLVPLSSKKWKIISENLIWGGQMESYLNTIYL